MKKKYIESECFVIEDKTGRKQKCYCEYGRGLKSGKLYLRIPCWDLIVEMQKKDIKKVMSEDAKA